MNVLRCISGFSWGADRETLTMLYIALIRSTLEYNSFLFSTISPTLCKRIEAVQSMSLRMISGAFRTSPILALRADTNLPALEDRRLFLLMRYYLRAKGARNHTAIAAMEANKPQTRRPLRRSCFLADVIRQARKWLNIPRLIWLETLPKYPSGSILTHQLYIFSITRNLTSHQLRCRRSLINIKTVTWIRCSTIQTVRVTIAKWDQRPMDVTLDLVFVFLTSQLYSLLKYMPLKEF